MRELNRIIIHCTDSEWGNVEEVDRWHKQRGWRGIGYHYLITNSYPTYNSFKDEMPSPEYNGVVHQGRSIEVVGSHCHGMNEDSIGVAMVGRGYYTDEQTNALKLLTNMLMKEHGIDWNNVNGHNYYDPRKGCPLFDVKGMLMEMIVKKYEPKFITERRKV